MLVRPRAPVILSGSGSLPVAVGEYRDPHVDPRVMIDNDSQAAKVVKRWALFILPHNKDVEGGSVFEAENP